MFKAIATSYRDAFAGLPRRVWLVALVTLIHRSGTMVLPFLPIYLTVQRGLDVRVAGVYLAVYGTGGVLGAMLAGWLAERIGNVRVMQATLVVAGLGFALLGVVRDPWILGAVLLVTSIAAEGFRTPSGAEVGLAAPQNIRARAFALRRLALNAGMAIGPAVGGLLATVSYAWLFAIDSATCLLAAVAVAAYMSPRSAIIVDDVEPQAATRGHAVSVWHNATFVATLACAGVMTLAFAQLASTYPLTLKQDFRYSEAIIGALMAWNTLLIIAFEMVLQHRLGGMHPPRIAAAGCLALVIGFALVPYDPRITYAVLAMTVITVGEMLTYPVIESFVVSLVREAAISRAVGLLNATFATTYLLAPLIGTLIYAAWGYRALWVTAAAVTMLAATGFVTLDFHARRSAIAR
jgi:MFS family permease